MTPRSPRARSSSSAVPALSGSFGRGAPNPTSQSDAPRPLPDRPSLEHLREQAKDLLAGFRREEPGAAQRIGRWVPTESGDSGTLRLSHAQLVLAREYGYASWARLRDHVTSHALEAAARAQVVVASSLPTKTCRVCGETKFLGHFSKTRARADGYQSACKTCMSAARRAREGKGERALPAVRALVLKGDGSTLRAVAEHSPKRAAWALRQAAQYGKPDVLAQILQDGPHTATALATALLEATQRHTTIPHTPGHDACVRLLLDAGADSNVRGGWTFSTPLEVAAATGAAESVRVLLLQHGARTNVWHHAALGNDTEVVRLVRETPGLASQPDEAGLGALHRCASSGLGRPSAETEAGLVRVARFLLENGVSPNAPNADVVDPKRRPQAPALLPPLHWAAYHGNLAVALLLLERGANPNADSEWGFVLGHAILHCPGLADALLERGVNVNASGPESGSTLLHGMANQPRPEAVRWLLAHGANPNATMREGRTPLHRAAERNAGPQVAMMLVDAGADANARDAAGMTPLGYALERGKLRVAEYLRSQGAHA